MVYVALLRGINVGGKNKVSMARLKAVFEAAGMKSVVTYINSGNVVFQSDMISRKEIVAKLEAAIEQGFGFAISMLVVDGEALLAVSRALPESWVNDTTMKCDAMFLWEQADTPEIMERIVIKPDIDNVKYVNGVLLWAVARTMVTRSGMMKLVGTPLYKQMTIRNCNTLRKLAVLVNESK